MDIVLNLLKSKRIKTPCKSVEANRSLFEKIATEIGYDRNSNSYPLDKIKDIRPSLILFLYKDAFLCRNLSSAKPEGYAQPYDRNARNFLASIDSGFIPRGLTKQIPCLFTQGYVVVEIQDFRHTDIKFPMSTASLPKTMVLKQSLQVPYTRRVVLRPTPEMVLESVFEMASIASSDAEIPLQVQLETILLHFLHPSDSICLDPSTDVVKVATLMYQNGTRGRYVKSSETFRYRALERILKRQDPLLSSGGARTQSTKRRRTSSSDASDSNRKKIKTPTGSDKPKRSRKKSSANNLSTPIGAPKELGITNTPASYQATKTEGWDFLTSLLEEAPDEKLSLTSDVSPSKIDKILSMDTNTKPIESVAVVEPPPPLPKVFHPCDITSATWFKAAEELHKKLALKASAELEHITNVQPLRSDRKGQLSSIGQLGLKIGKTLWPTETIANARVRHQNRQKSLNLPAKSPLRGAALAEATAFGLIN